MKTILQKPTREVTLTMAGWIVTILSVSQGFMTLQKFTLVPCAYLTMTA